MKMAIIGLATALLAAANVTAEPTRLVVDSGILIGESQDQVSVFKGVPYAAPPVGALRWRPPQPVHWEAERDATHFALPCAQQTGKEGRRNRGGVSGPTAEDCLYLNVWKPKDAKNAPVMVWLHGGAGFLGAGSLDVYDGSSFAKEGVIVVTINYRLGMLGQFAHPALTKAAEPNELLANYQLMDAIAALEWVQHNGEALGANTSNVTLFGQSAGAVLVAALLSTPPSRGLFHKAIIQSAVPLLGGTRSMAQAEADGVKFAGVLGLPGAEATPEQLRALPLDSVISSDARGPGFSNGSYLIIDGKIRPGTTGEGFEDKRTVDIPLIVGSTRAEFFGPSVYEMANTAAAHIGSHVWQYFFDYVPRWSVAEQPKGPPHAAELPYVFNSLDHTSRISDKSQITNADRAVARQMHSCWVAFAKSQRMSPEINCSNGFRWLEHTLANDAIAVFGANASMQKAGPLIDQNKKDFPMRPGIGEP